MFSASLELVPLRTTLRRNAVRLAEKRCLTSTAAVHKTSSVILTSDEMAEQENGVPLRDELVGGPEVEVLYSESSEGLGLKTQNVETYEVASWVDQSNKQDERERERE